MQVGKESTKIGRRSVIFWLYFYANYYPAPDLMIQPDLEISKPEANGDSVTYFIE
jgi:hypothetical protein